MTTISLGQGGLIYEPKQVTPEAQLEEFAREISAEVDKASQLVPVLASLIAVYALEPRFTNWYTTLRSVGSLPKRLPFLSFDKLRLRQMFDAPAPKGICNKKKGDGTLFTIGETCTLMLVPQELGTICEMGPIFKIFDEKRFRPFTAAIHQKNGSLSPEPTHWVLSTNDILPNSQNKVYQEQRSVLDLLGQETNQDWRLPNARDRVAMISLNYVARKNRLEEIPDFANPLLSNTYFIVEEVARGESDWLIAELSNGQITFPRIGIALLSEEQFVNSMFINDFMRFGAVAQLKLSHYS